MGKRRISLNLEGRWKNCNESYPDRDRLAIDLLEGYEVSSVYDLGCGNKTLQKYFTFPVVYFPVDKYDRGIGTIVKDFDKKEYPLYTVDCSIVLGVFEYIKELQSFIDFIEGKTTRVLVCSFSFLESFQHREKCGWINHLSRDKFLKKFKRFEVVRSRRIKSWEIFLMEKVK